MEWKKISSLLVLTSWVWFLSISCSTPMPSSFTKKSTIRDVDVARLEPGMSEKEVMEILGSKPESRLTSPDGNMELTWSSEQSVRGLYEDKEGKTISILFTPDGKMIRVIR